MYRGWAWAMQHLGRRIENRRWSPADRFRGCMVAIHSAQKIGDFGDRNRPFGKLYHGVKELAALTWHAKRAGWEARYDPIRRLVLVDDDGHEVFCSPETLPPGAIIGFTRLVGWRPNPADRDLGRWRLMPEHIVRSRGWARPGWWGFHFDGFIPVPHTLVRGWDHFWTLPRKTLEDISEAVSPETSRALVEMAGQSTRPIYPVALDIPDPPKVDWSKMIVRVAGRPSKRHPARTMSVCFQTCEFCPDAIMVGDRYACTPPSSNIRRAHFDCAPGLGKAVGDTTGRYGNGFQKPRPAFKMYRGKR